MYDMYTKKTMEDFKPPKGYFEMNTLVPQEWPRLAGPFVYTETTRLPPVDLIIEAATPFHLVFGTSLVDFEPGIHYMKCMGLYSGRQYFYEQTQTTAGWQHPVFYFSSGMTPLHYPYVIRINPRYEPHCRFAVSMGDGDMIATCEWPVCMPARWTMDVSNRLFYMCVLRMNMEGSSDLPPVIAQEFCEVEYVTPGWLAGHQDQDSAALHKTMHPALEYPCAPPLVEGVVSPADADHVEALIRAHFPAVHITKLYGRFKIRRVSSVVADRWAARIRGTTGYLTFVKQDEE